MRKTLVLAFSLLAASSVAAAPGATYVIAHGLHKIDDAGKVTTIAKDKASVANLAIDVKGDLWFSTFDGKIHKGKLGKSVRLPKKGDDERYAAAWARAKKGGMWVMGRAGLYAISPALKLTTHPLPDGLPENRAMGPQNLLEDEGTVWLANQQGVFKYDGKKWDKVRDGFHEHLVRDSNGVLWTVAKTKDKQLLAGWDGTKWHEHALKSEGAAEIAAGKDGRIFVLAWGKGWKESRLDVLTTTKGASPKWATKVGNLDALYYLAVDESERIWTSQHRGGLLVLDKDGKVLAKLEHGTVAGLAGSVSALAVVAGGPTTMPTPTAVPKATVIGRIMKTAKEPQANTKYELCTGWCSSNGPRYPFTTDADGRFTIVDVPVMEANEIVDVATNTYFGGLPFKKSCCLDIKAGKTFDLGTAPAPVH